MTWKPTKPTEYHPYWESTSPLSVNRDVIKADDVLGPPLEFSLGF